MIAAGEICDPRVGAKGCSSHSCPRRHLVGSGSIAAIGPSKKEHRPTLRLARG